MRGYIPREEFGLSYMSEFVAAVAAAESFLLTFRTDRAKRGDHFKELTWGQMEFTSSPRHAKIRIRILEFPCGWVGGKTKT